MIYRFCLKHLNFDNVCMLCCSLWMEYVNVFVFFPQTRLWDWLVWERSGFCDTRQQQAKVVESPAPLVTGELGRCSHLWCESARTQSPGHKSPGLPVSWVHQSRVHVARPSRRPLTLGTSTPVTRPSFLWGTA